ARHQVRAQGAGRPRRHRAAVGEVMSVTDDIPTEIAQVLPDADGAPAVPAPARVLMVWDAPNLDMGLGSILGGRPTASHRPRFDRLRRRPPSRPAELSAPP